MSEWSMVNEERVFFSPPLVVGAAFLRRTLVLKNINEQ